MTDTSSDTTETNSIRPTRRQVIATLGAAGAFAATAGAQSSSDGSLTAGGGEMADQAAQFRVNWYEGPLSDRPEPGVEGRYYRALDDNGAVYYDDGSSWSAVDLGVGSLSADSLYTESRQPTLIVRRDGDEAVVETTSGEAIRSADHTAVLQAAFDAVDSDTGTWQTIAVRGDFEVTDTLHPRSETVIDMWGARLIAQPEIPDSAYVIRTEDDTWEIRIFGGVIDGNKDDSGMAGNSSDPRGLLIGGHYSESPSREQWEEARHVVFGTKIVDIPGEFALRGDSRRALYQSISVQNCEYHGVRSVNSDQTWIDIHVEGVDNRAFHLSAAGAFNTFFRPIAERCGEGWYISADAAQPLIYGGYSEYCDEHGMLIENAHSYRAFPVVHAHTFISNNLAENDRPAVEIIGTDQCMFNNCFFWDTEDPPTQQEAIRVTSGAETRIYGCEWSENPNGGVVDNGTRTLVNGRGTNSGDPSSTGEWNGAVDYAEQFNAIIEDTTNSNLYTAKSDGAWSQIGT